MNNTKILIGIFTISCFCLGGVSFAQAQEENVRTLPGQPLTRGFAIQNNDYEKVIIVNVSKNKKNWTPVSINPRRSRDFICGQANFVRISTENSGKVQYRIDCDKGRRYSVEWDQSRNLWDIYKLKSE